MAADFWTSTQHRFWHFTTSQLAAFRSELQSQHTTLISQHPCPDHRHVLIFLKDQLLRLSRRLQARQQCLATALVYLHRYLLSHPIQTVNPYLLLSTAFYLASKTEECPNHVRVVLGEARQLWPEFVRADVASIGEMEFSIISELRSQLIIWHPYRTLLDLKVSDQEDGLELHNDEVGLAWNIINDSYLTDLPLTCAPHEIALTAILLAVTFHPAHRSTKAVQSLSALHGSVRSTTTTTPTAIAAAAAAPSPTGLPSQGVAGRSATPSIPGNIPGLGSSPTINGKPSPPQMHTEKIRSVQQFVARSSFDLTKIMYATQELISLYEVWESYSEKEVKEALVRVVRAKER